MKKILFMIMAIFFLVGCQSNGASEENDVEQPEANNELEKLGLTYNQSLKFDEYVQAVSNSVEELQDFSFKVENDYSNLKETDLADILISSSDIESAYADNGGQSKEDILNFLQESNTGFYGIANNLFEHKRGYTPTEAYACLSTLTSYAGELGKEYGLEEDDVKSLEKYFLKNITPKGNFIEARDELLDKRK